MKIKYLKNKYFYLIISFILLINLNLFFFSLNIYAYSDNLEDIIYYEFKKADNAKANIVITNEIEENCQKYKNLIKELKKNKYNVFLYDIRGYNKSSKNKIDNDNLEILLKDLQKILMFLKNKNKLPNFLLGNFIGGILNNCYAIKYNDVKGIINIATPTSIFKSYFLNLENNNELKIIKNNIKITQNFIQNIMILGINYLNENLDKYKVPFFVLHGQKDSIVPYDNSTNFFTIVAVNKKIKLYENSDHNLFNDSDYKQVNLDIIEWLNKQIN
ncbi:probable lysophospholipase [Candidatus Phytoplasma mali]|uniref:Probable lysophospholipase n=1 Tax=Phytoplasma mali (strain AT) TaxID=482235 RepID=B3QZH6_PHYMT|nr:alpha/beta fold hydrolase [Candidatus Phytoplasma mali]CAP18583.1 probable lysophospholipase [Candidatus Phytoplasma mali]